MTKAIFNLLNINLNRYFKNINLERYFKEECSDFYANLPFSVCKLCSFSAKIDILYIYPLNNSRELLKVAEFFFHLILIWKGRKRYLYVDVKPPPLMF